jgi:hypothetical protein
MHVELDEEVALEDIRVVRGRVVGFAGQVDNGRRLAGIEDIQGVVIDGAVMVAPASVVTLGDNLVFVREHLDKTSSNESV